MHILSIHLDFPYLRISRLRKSRKKIDIAWTKSIAMALDLEAEEVNVKRLYIDGFRGKVVSGLSAKDFLIRPLDVKIASKSHVEEAIAFQSEALSHFKPGEVLTIPVIERKQKGRAEGFVLTIPREGLGAHLGELEKLGVDPDVVSTVPSALYHYVRWKFPTLSDAFIVDLGSNAITSVSMVGSRMKKAHAISMGIEDLLNALFEDRKRILLKKEIEPAAKQIDLLLLKSQLNPRLSRELIALKQELSKIYYPYNGMPVIFTGRSDAFIHLQEFLMESALLPLTLEEQKSAVSLGLCLEQTSKQPLQLRREEFFPRKNWVRMGRLALFLMAASIILSFSLIFLGIGSVNRSKNKMLNAVLHGEKEIDQWIEGIENNNKEYPYILQSPRVFEFLSWLSSNPLLEELKREGDAIDIREIRTQLMNFPTIHSPNEPYLMKVDLEFRFKSAMNARKFHEMLREGDDWVDPNLEITWDTLNESYSTSFYLKNRSPYVP